MTAPVGDTDFVVTEMPLTGSKNVRPTARGASLNDVVWGVASSSCDWVIVVVLGAIRIVIPFTTGSVGEKLSKMPVGWRNSNWKYVPSLRAILNRRGDEEPARSAGARV